MKFLGCNAPTDVIAFNFNEPADSREIIADIAISTDTAIRNARNYKTTRSYELYLYVVHGVLHILGYKDNNKANSSVMQRKEEYLCQLIKPKP